MDSSAKYTARYFRNDMPEWKRRKDPLPLKIFYRPVSFRIVAFCTNLARSVKPQPFGEFVDAESSYTLAALLGL